MKELLEDSHELKLMPIGNGKWWMLTDRWCVDWSIGYDIPKGFLTDMDSVPRIPFVYAWIKGASRRAAVLHDYLYATGLESRKKADLIFYHYMVNKEGVSRITAYAAYRAVRLMGGRYYNKFQKIKSVDERLRRRVMSVDGTAECLTTPISKKLKGEDHG